MTAPASLEDLLDQMADALQRGALGDLGGLSRDIEAGIAGLPALDALRARGLQRRAARNEVCLQAAARGVRAAIARIAGISGTAQQLSIYGADGRKVLVGGAMVHHSSRL